MKSRQNHIDGLRGIAALLVLLQHLIEQLGSLAPAHAVVAPALSMFFLQYIDMGKLGVVAFFAISGFIIPYSFNPPAPRTGFVISRFFRLYPAYWLSIAVAMVLLPLIGRPEPSSMQVLVNLTMLQDALHQPRVLDVYWTLFIELLFYAMCLLGYRWGLLRSARAILVVFLCLLAVAFAGAWIRGQGGPRIPTAIPLYLAIMWFSAALRLFVLEGDRQAKRYCVAMLPLLLLATPYIWSMAYSDQSHKESVLASIMGIYAGLAMFLWCVFRKVFGASLWVYFGSISYSIYLFHPLALDLGAYWAADLAWPHAGVVLAVVATGLSVIVAHLVFNGVEKPAINWGRALSRRFVGSR